MGWFPCDDLKLLITVVLKTEIRKQMSSPIYMHYSLQTPAFVSLRTITRTLSSVHMHTKIEWKHYVFDISASIFIIPFLILLIILSRPSDTLHDYSSFFFDLIKNVTISVVLSFPFCTSKALSLRCLVYIAILFTHSEQNRTLVNRTCLNL